MTDRAERGFRLMSMRLGRPRLYEPEIGLCIPPWLIDEAEYSTPRPAPPFLLHDGSLDAAITRQVLREGWSWNMLQERSPDVLHWRQPLQHIEFSNFVSLEVFETLRSLAPDSFTASWQVTLVDPMGSSVDYVFFDVLPVDMRELVLREQCEPPLSPDNMQIPKDVAVLCYDVDRMRDDCVFGPAYDWTVTSEFQRRWLDSPVSKFMRSTNGEYDYAFEESNGFSMHGQLTSTPYTWGKA